MQRTTTLAMLVGPLLLVLAVMMPTGSAQAQVCADFDSFAAPVLRSSPWNVSAPGWPPPAQFEFSNISSDGTHFVIEEGSPGNNWLYFPWWECGAGCSTCGSSCITGSGPGALMIRAYMSSGLPNHMSFYLVNGTNAGYVRAYASPTPVSGETPIFQQLIPQNIVVPVEIVGVGEIGRVEIEGGDNEDYIDDVCIDIL